MLSHSLYSWTVSWNYKAKQETDNSTKLCRVVGRLQPVSSFIHDCGWRIMTRKFNDSFVSLALQRSNDPLFSIDYQAVPILISIFSVKGTKRSYNLNMCQIWGFLVLRLHDWRMLLLLRKIIVWVQGFLVNCLRFMIYDLQSSWQQYCIPHASHRGQHLLIRRKNSLLPTFNL